MSTRRWFRVGFLGGVVGLIGAVSPGAVGSRVWAGQDPVARGRETFQARCAVCHTVGGGVLVGPDLQGVDQRRSEAWILEFVRSSQALVRAGDPDAVAIFERFNRIMMPDHALADQEIRAILAYIGGPSSAETTGPPAVPAATPEQVERGRDLFQGVARLANGGPTCTSCHHVRDDAVIGGGVLARELTTVFSRLGGPGVRAILGSPPFPVMQRAYRDTPLEEAEVASLVAFLQRADEEHALHQPADYGVKLLAAGLLGTALLLGLSALVWRGRRTSSVNQEIYDRQLSSM